jgi:hypothetical protein
MKLVPFAWLVAPVPRISSQSTFAIPQAWGQSAHGLRMGISVSPSNLSRTTAEFSLALENTGDSDFVLNLGSMLGNGKVMFPAAIRLILIARAGNMRELGFFDRRYGVVGGRVDGTPLSSRSLSSAAHRSLQPIHSGRRT